MFWGEPFLEMGKIIIIIIFIMAGQSVSQLKKGRRREVVGKF